MIRRLLLLVVILCAAGTIAHPRAVYAWCPPLPNETPHNCPPPTTQPAPTTTTEAPTTTTTAAPTTTTTVETPATTATPGTTVAAPTNGDYGAGDVGTGINEGPNQLPVTGATTRFFGGLGLAMVLFGALAVWLSKSDKRGP